MSFTHWNKRLRLGLALLASGTAFGLPGMAAAQTGFSAPAFREDPGTALSRHLKTLADSPRNMSALMGAAKAALELGDAQAAVTFYARAEAIAPRDGRIKAGIGSAFLAMEQPENALRFFEEARSLGAPEGEFAADRGLAYDLTGNSAQAQRDYQLAMRGHDNDELRRRLALSKAITGDRAGALAAIDDQLRRQDRAAWRVRAFVLALTGDPAGATETARQMMPQQAAAMQPFFARLPALRPADRAMAVHFGHFPGDGSIAAAPTYAAATPVLPPAVTEAGRPSGTQLASRAPVTTPSPVLQNQGPRRAISGPVQSPPQAAATAPARPPARQPAPARDSGSLAQRWADARGLPVGRTSSRPQAAQTETQPRAEATSRPVQGSPALSEPVRLPTPAPAPTQFAAAQPSMTLPPAATPVVNTAASAPANAAPTISLPVSTTLRSSAPPPPSAPAASSATRPTNTLQAATSTLTPAPASSTAAPPQLTATSPAASAPVQGPPVSTSPTPLTPAVTTPAPIQAVATSPAPAERPTLSAGLASVAETIRALDLGETAAKPQAEPKKAEPAKPAAKPDTKPAAAAAQHWVQIAGSADKSTLKGEFARLKAKAPKLLGDKTAWTAPLKFTNRLLVGPFKSEGEAQSLVNELAKAELAAFAWTSPAGQPPEKIATN
jgi:Flp pilus assembly protein TadD